jgi:hypothetical protein
MLKTSDICRLVRKDPVVSLLVPQECGRSLPVPFKSRGRVLVGFYFYPVSGAKGETKHILSPVARIAMDKETGRVVEAVAAPHCRLAGHGDDTAVASFPPAALKGISEPDADTMYGSYFALCDTIAECLREDVAQPAAFREWKHSYETLKEPGFEGYYSTFLDKESTPAASERRETSPAERRPVPLHTFSGRIAALDLTPHLKDLESVVRDVGNEQVGRKWSQIRKSIASSAFRVGLVGEFLRGKTTVANTILGEEILPVGDTPTTALPIRIAYSKARTLRHTTPDGVTTELPFSVESLREFVVGANEKPGYLSAGLPCEWLRDGGIELVDTPGVGQPSEESLSSIERVIAECDATLVCVNATMPLSLTERAFIEECVLANNVPCVALVLTRLDLVPVKERDSVALRIEHKLAEWGIRVPVWCINDVPLERESSLSIMLGPARVRAAITRWAKTQDRVALRKVQIASQALDVCSLLTEVIQAQIAGSQACSVDTGGEEHTANRADETTGEKHWEELTDLIDERELLLERGIEKDLSELQRDLMDELQYELSRTRNPREWWDKDLPYKLRRFLKRVKRDLDGRVSKTLAHDINFFNKKLAEHLTTSLALPELPHEKSAEGADIIPSPDDLADLDRIRMWTRIGAGVLTAAGYMVLGAPAMLLSLTGGIAGDRAIGGRIEEQRHRLRLALDEVIDKAVQMIISRSRKHIRRIYGNLGSELETRRNASKEARVTGAAQEDAQEQPHSRLRDILQRTETIEGALVPFVEGDGQ